MVILYPTKNILRQKKISLHFFMTSTFPLNATKAEQVTCDCALIMASNMRWKWKFSSKTNSFYRLLATFSWILIRRFANQSFVLELWLLWLTVKAVAVSTESCVVSSVRTNFLFNLWLSLAPKRLLFVSYRNQKRAAKYSQFFTARKQPSVNFNLLHNNYCAQAHSVPRVWKSNFFFLWGLHAVCIDLVILISHNAYHVHTELFSLEYFSLE